MEPLMLLDDWLANAPLRPSTQTEYRREVRRWLTWCAAQKHPRVHPYHVGPEHVARWCETYLRRYLGDIPFTGPEALEVLAAEHPDAAKTHDRRITALVQYYEAAKNRRLVLQPPHLYDLRSGIDRDKGTPQRLDPRERAAFQKAIGAWGPDRSQHHLRDQLVAQLLLAGLRPAQVVRLDQRLMEEQPDGGWHCRVPDQFDGPGRPVELDPLIGDAIREYLPHRPTPKPGVWTLLLSRTGRPLYSRFCNELVRAIADTSPRLAQRPRPVTADTVAHTGLWDEPAPAAPDGQESRPMPWNTLTVLISRSKGFGEPLYGEGGWTHEQAHAEMLTLLERLADEHPGTLDTVLGLWRRGAKDDTAYAPAPDGLTVFALYEYPDGEHPVHGATAWLDDFSKRATGRPAQMIVPPTGPGGTSSSRADPKG